MRRWEFISLIGSRGGMAACGARAATSVVPENLIRAGSRHEADSAHHST